MSPSMSDSASRSRAASNLISSALWRPMPCLAANEACDHRSHQCRNALEKCPGPLLEVLILRPALVEPAKGEVVLAHLLDRPAKRLLARIKTRVEVNAIRFFEMPLDERLVRNRPPAIDDPGDPPLRPLARIGRDQREGYISRPITFMTKGLVFARPKAGPKPWSVIITCYSDRASTPVAAGG